MVLSVDVGNSFIKFALFDGDEPAARFSVSTVSGRSIDEYVLFIKNFFEEFIEDGQIEASVLSSVVPSVTDAISSAVESVVGKRPFVIGRGTHTGFKIKIYDPSELGADIVSNVAAASAAYGYPCVVIDLGTATTLTAVDKNGDVMGTVIHPGLKVCLSSLAETAAKLNEVEMVPGRKLIGQNSSESIISGVINGHVCMINGLLDRIISEIGGDNAECVKVVATGENADIIIPLCKMDVIIDKDLTHKGNVLLYRLNAKRN